MNTAGGMRRLKIEQISSVMGTSKRYFPMIYSFVKPSQNCKNVTPDLTLFKYVNSSKESLLAFISDI